MPYDSRVAGTGSKEHDFVEIFFTSLTCFNSLFLKAFAEFFSVMYEVVKYRTTYCLI